MLSLGSKDNDDENDNDTSCITSPFPVVLVMGATCVDRILFCPHHPQPDEKLRTTHTTEVSGGNAANTAAALALVSSAAAFRFRFRFRHNNKNSLRVVLVTKVGDDESGANLEKDLESKGVDCSTPFFEKVPNTTTSITTVIVSESQHTRTCLYTPGSCGEWTKEQILQRLQSYDLFRNVVWFHSDSRHTEAALVLANEATKRGIPISVDVEKDRGGGMPRLVAQASVLFGNQEKLQQYAIRRLLLPQQHLDVNPISAFLEDQSSDEKVLPKNIKSVVVTR